MILADRLNKIIKEQGLNKRAFAKKLGVTEQYVHLLTGNSKSRPNNISPALAKLIALEFGYDENWIMNGDKEE